MVVCGKCELSVISKKGPTVCRAFTCFCGMFASCLIAGAGLLVEIRSAFGFDMGMGLIQLLFEQAEAQE